MTTSFNPQYYQNPKLLDENYLSCDPESSTGLTCVKKDRFFSNWIGKLIRWIFHWDEHISRVRDVYQKVFNECVSQEQDSHPSVAIYKDKNLYNNASTFNSRVIVKHNSSWIGSLFWNYVVPLNLNELIQKFRSNLASIKDNITKCELSPANIENNYYLLYDTAPNILNNLSNIAEIKNEVNDTYITLLAKRTDFINSLKSLITKTRESNQLTADEIVVIVKLKTIQNQLSKFERRSPELENLYTSIQEITTHHANIHLEFESFRSASIVPGPKPTFLMTHAVIKMLSSKFISVEDKKWLKAAYLKEWHNHFVHARYVNEGYVKNQLAKFNNTYEPVHLNTMEHESVAIKAFEEFIATLPPESIAHIVEARKNFEEHLKTCQAVVEKAKTAYKLLQEAVIKPQVDEQDIAKIQEVATAFGEQPYHAELKKLIQDYVSILQRRQNIVKD